MKTGQCVELRFSTVEQRPRGIVTRVQPTRFRVSYESHRDEKTGRRIPGGRFWYPLSSSRFFQVIG